MYFDLLISQKQALIFWHKIFSLLIFLPFSVTVFAKILSRTISKLLQIIGQICTFDIGTLSG